MSRSRRDSIEHIITTVLTPIFLNVEDESSQHHVPQGAQTHFKVTAVSAEFTGLNAVARHRKVNHLLKEEFDQGMHALSLHLYTPEEWEKRKDYVVKSPSCKDGYKNT